MRLSHMFESGPAIKCTAIVLVLACSSALTAQQKAPERNVKARESIGNATAGRDVFRFETFGNEGFWTDAMRLPKGMEDEKFTPLMALEAGLHVDVEAVPPELKSKLAAEFKTDLSAKNAPLLNDPKIALALVKANAVIGVVPKGDKVGISCAICHTITDNSVFEMPGKGSVGRRLDGRATHSLEMGKLLALAANSRAYYPNLQLELGGETIGRAPRGLRKDSSEAEVDAYLKNDEFYPRGTFDETQDGIGNPVQNTPLFRQDLAGPYGSAGEFDVLDHISNASYTTNLDPTSLVTSAGREFLKAKAGKLGEELADNFEAILTETGVKGYPFVDATTGHKVGDLASPVGRQVDMQKVRDMSAYLKALPAPPGAKVNAQAAARGQKLFAEKCTTCHHEDQSRPVPSKLVDLKQLWPAYQPKTLAKRAPPLSPIVDSAGGFDDKMIIVDASDRGEKRGNAVALLLDLARKPVFLHDASVSSLNALLDPQRGEEAPHPFYLSDKAQRADMLAFLTGLSVGPSKEDPRNGASPPAIKQPGPAPK